MERLRRYGFPAFMMIALAAALFFRGIHPSADPFSDTFIDTQDEGLHSYAARNYIMHGTWTVDSLDYGAIMPVYPRIQVMGLYVLGFHNYAFRLASVLAAGASVLLIGLFLYAEWGLLPAMIASAYMATHHFLVGVSRSALPESTMLFLCLATFVLWHWTLRSKHRFLLWGFATGMMAAATFFTKQSSAPVLGMIGITYIYAAIVSGNKRKYIQVGGGMTIAAALTVILYAGCVYLPNKDIWYANYRATVGGNRPRKALIIPSYLASQIKDTAASPFWRYVPVLALLSAAALIGHMKERYKKGRLPEPEPAHLAAVWLILFLLYMISVPDRYARFLAVAIPPMIVLTSSLFRTKGRYSRLVLSATAVVVAVDILVNISVNVKTVVMRPTYVYANAAAELWSIVGKQKGIYPIHWIINYPFNAMSTYVATVGDNQFRAYFDTYGWPEYVSLTDAQIADFKKRAPRYLAHLNKIRRIDNYTLFRLSRF